MKKKSAGYQIGLVLVIGFGVVFLGHIFGAATQKSSVDKFADESRRGLANYYRELCQSGDKRGCEEYDRMTKEVR
jgi:hypothetical protein